MGSFFGIVICETALDRIYNRLQPRQPENRLPLSIAGAFLLPLSVLLYGWSASFHLPVPVLLLAVGLLGLSNFLAVVPLLAYVIDAFGLYAASALTAVLVTRCLMGTFLPLATQPLVERLGLGWGFTVLAGLCLGMAPIPVLVLRFGGAWRRASEFTKGPDGSSPEA